MENARDLREPNKAYAELRAKLIEKYWPSIEGLSNYHGGMETYICFDVLCSNARACARGDVEEIWPGAGKLDMNVLCADVKMLDALARYNW